MQREWNLPSAVAKSWFYQGRLKRPFGKRAVAAQKDRVDLQEHIRVEFPRLLKKFCQTFLGVELQLDPVILEAELVGEYCYCILYVALVQVRDNRQHYLSLAAVAMPISLI